MKRLLSILCVTVLCFAYVTVPAHATEGTIERGIVSDVAAVTFDPAHIYTVIEYPKGNLKFFRGTFAPQPLDASPLRNEQKFVVAGPIFLEAVANQDSFNVSFLLFDASQKVFQSTAVRAWSFSDLKRKTPSLPELKKSIAKLESNLLYESVGQNSQSSELFALREKLSEITDIAALVKLRLDIQQRRAILDQKIEEIRRLRQLVLLARDREEKESIVQLRFDLADDLRNVAAATARTERLERRKLHSAETTIRNKLKLVRETQDADVNALAFEALRLRERRRQLEVKLGVPAKSEAQAEF